MGYVNTLRKSSLIGIFCLCIACGRAAKKVGGTLVSAKPVTVEKSHRRLFGFDLTAFNIVRGTLKRGDNLSAILSPYQVDYQKIAQAGKRRDAFDLRSLKAGKRYVLFNAKDAADSCEIFVYQPDLVHYVVLDMRDSLRIYKAQRPVTETLHEASGLIESSLYEAVKASGAPDLLSSGLSDLYAWTIDFFHLQKGDKFKVIYREKYVRDSLYIGMGAIEAAYFEHRGEPYYAFRYETDSARGIFGYYSCSAHSLRRQFLKAPLRFSHVSSHYSLHRFHPILHRWKAHLGTDFTAPYGTPIMATASGVVIASTYRRGNGNYVKIRHNRTYTTQYLHMSKRLVKRGQYVKQGQVIGRVGSTGWATGPHVCYRFWKNGRQVDPFRQHLPPAKPIKKSKRAAYLAYIKPLKAELDALLYHTSDSSYTVNEKRRRLPQTLKAPQHG